MKVLDYHVVVMYNNYMSNTQNNGIGYELWDAQSNGNDALLKAVRVTSTSDHAVADQRAIAVVKAHIKSMGYTAPLALYRQDGTIAWEA